MVIGISKRHQFRNERTLQDLIRSVPGNDRCAECQAVNPSWASWNLGVFLCMRCAALHRKLGTHISKVKSLSMDSWTSEQVDSMRMHGNTIVNQIYNPKNVKPAIPTDVDEADSCMERFIRQKYQYRSLEDGKPKPPSRHGSDGPGSPEGSPPPLPPKTGKIFGLSGLRSASSTSNLRRPSSNNAPPARRGSLSPPSTSQGMGTSVAEIGTVSFASKLTTLRDMGFPDDKRNALILKGLGGDLEKTIDSLVRMGEGHPASRSRTPITSTRTGNAVKQEQKVSTNPFDQLDAKPQNQPSGQSYNPFDMPTPQSATVPSQSLESSFQNLQVSQPLFPHSTGGYPPQHSLSQPLPQHSATPPVTSTFTQGAFVSSPQAVDGSYNPFFQTTQPQYGASFTQSPTASQNNPFFSQMPQQNTMQQQTQGSMSSTPSLAAPCPPRHANTMPAFSSTSPFGQSPFQQQQPQPTQMPQTSHNPYHAMTAPTTPQNGVYENQYQQSSFQPPQQLAPQPTGRMDKSSILALYNFSPPPPAISEQPQPVPGLSTSINSTPQSQPVSSPQSAQTPTGSRNPFMTSPAQPNQTQPQAGFGMAPKSQTTPGYPRTHMSQPSVDINNLQNGRYSPDAFASLSARYG
ncbi:GTPase Activating Protein [Aspergillus sclerotialis]|uniref:GTPase Activating Protein n=1 Tax=Aspergillus sclerotialis TaxID=2070753 RepID=A0A3A2ZJN3_9EURO|nr:GTPase Activating Protein [Aspergillus sclerotialis]